MGPGDLTRALASLPRHHDPRLLVGHETFDDAGVFVLTDDLALVQTVDFFAPIVDDPWAFGQIAAANALSDVYAMGGEPLTALAIAAFPSATVRLEVLTEIFRGAHEKVHEAGAIIVGGHTIIDDEVKYGLAVTGRVDPRRVLTNAAARAGERVVLTKPIGTGVLATAAKQGLLDEHALAAAVDSMRELNANASKTALELGAKCATDVTGFGLLGHASHIARASDVSIVVRAADVPLLAGALEAWRAGARTGGAERNASWLSERVEWGAASEEVRAMLIDPQTSGGLLVTLPAERVADYVSRIPRAVEIGEVVPRAARDIIVR